MDYCLWAGGLVEIVTTPFAWIVKPITRGLATSALGAPRIEDSKGIKHLVHVGLEKLETPEISREEKEENPSGSSRRIYDLLALCNDVHRKFDRGVLRGQYTQLDVSEEQGLFQTLQGNPDAVAIKNYFSLFETVLPVPEETPLVKKPSLIQGQ